MEVIQRKSQVQQLTKEGEIDESRPDVTLPNILYDSTDDYMKKLINEMEVNKIYQYQVDKMNKNKKMEA